jgi:hypothetical protein
VGAQVDVGAAEVGSQLRIADIRETGSGFDLNFTTEAGWQQHLESKDAHAVAWHSRAERLLIPARLESCGGQG